MAEPLLQVESVTKIFPGVVANDQISFDVQAGEIHALLGENGAGKTTLVSTLYGLHQPDSGRIRLRGQTIQLRSSRDAIALGIGMVHQHFMLIQPFSVAENIVLGSRSPREPLLELAPASRKLSGYRRLMGWRWTRPPRSGSSPWACSSGWRSSKPCIAERTC